MTDNAIVSVATQPVNPLDTPLATMTPGQVEQQVEVIKRVAEAQKQLVLAAVTRTYAHDWQDFGGKPYLEGEGADRLAGIGLKLGEPVFDVAKEDGEYHVECLVCATWPAMGCEGYGLGSCSTRDKFFVGREDSKSRYNQLLVLANGVEAVAKRMLLPDVKKKAYQNAKSRAVSEVMGLHGITWADLKPMGITPEKAGVRVDYKKGAKKTDRKSAVEPAISVEKLTALPIDSRASLKGTIVRTSQMGKRRGFQINDGTDAVWIIRWAATPDDPMPEWASEGQAVFCKNIRVAEYQGSRQYVAESIEPIDAEPQEPPSEQPTSTD